MSQLDLDTQRAIDELIEAMLTYFPRLLGIDDIIPNCEVTDNDPEGVGTTTLPRTIRVRVNQYQQFATYRGFPDGVLTGDYLTVVHIAQGDTYEVLGAGGSTGSISGGGGVSTPPHFSSEEILLNLTFDHLKFSHDEDGEVGFTHRYYFLTSRRDRCWIWPTSADYDSRGPNLTMPSLWRFRRAWRASRACENLVTNPSFEVDTAGWASALSTINRTMEWAHSQVWSLDVIATAQFGGVSCTLVAPGAGTYSSSIWMKAESSTIRFVLYNATLASTLGTVYHPGDGQWHRLVVNSGTIGAGENLAIWVQDTAAGSWTHFQVDAAQIEFTAYHTPYCDGDLGDGQAWSGTNHATSSTRSRGYISLVDQVNTISQNDSFAVRCVVQAPYDSDFAYWPYDPSPIWDARGASDNNRITLRYNATTDQFNVFINGAVLLQSSTQTFTEGEWFDIIIKFNFGLYDAFELWINGVQEDTFGSLYGLSAPTLTDWQLGADITTAGREAGWVFAEYTVYESDSLLTETLIEQLYLTGPTIDPDSVLEERIMPPAFWDHLITDQGPGGSDTSWIELPAGERFILAGEWGTGWWLFEINADSASEPNDAEIKIQYYDEINAAWRDVPGSLIVITASAMQRYLSYPLSVIRSMHEFRIVRRHPSEIVTSVYKARIFNSYGGDATL